MALAGATAATTFGSMGLGMSPLSPHYPLAFHHLAQTYMHAVWRQGLCPSSSSSSTSATSSASATVSLQAWNTATNPTLQSCRPLSAVKADSAAAMAGLGDRGKQTLTPAQRMREYREKLKRNPEVYQRYKQMNAMRSRLARMRRTQEQVEKDRERARQRNMKYRGPGSELDLAALAAEGSALDFSSAGAVTPPPTHLLHELPARLPHPLQDRLLNLPTAVFPSCSTDDWEPPVTFGEPSESP